MEYVFAHTPHTYYIIYIAVIMSCSVSNSRTVVCMFIAHTTDHGRHDVKTTNGKSRSTFIIRFPIIDIAAAMKHIKSKMFELYKNTLNT